MARIRTIKPSFFRSEDVSVLPLRARLTWIGLWTHCDDAGRTKDNVRLIKGDIWPLDDVSLRDIEEDLETLAAAGRIVRYEVDGKRYLEIVNWRDHQSIQKPTPSRIPPAPGSPARPIVRPAAKPVTPDPGPDPAPSTSTPVDSGSPTVGVPEPDSTAIAGKGREGKGREGKGTRAQAPAEEPPPLRCPKHHDTATPPPCGPCGDARRHRQQWDRDQAAATAAAVAEAQQSAALERAELVRTAIAACGMCDEHGYLPTSQLCSHDPDKAERTRRGAALAAAALRREPAGAAS